MYVIILVCNRVRRRGKISHRAQLHHLHSVRKTLLEEMVVLVIKVSYKIDPDSLNKGRFRSQNENYSVCKFHASLYMIELNRINRDMLVDSWDGMSVKEIWNKMDCLLKVWVHTG